MPIVYNRSMHEGGSLKGVLREVDPPGYWFKLFEPRFVLDNDKREVTVNESEKNHFSSDSSSPWRGNSRGDEHRTRLQYGEHDEPGRVV